MIKRGFEFKYVYLTTDRKEFSAKAWVAEIDPKIGITCIGYTKTGKQQEFLCLNKEDFDRGKYDWYYDSTWEEMFAEHVEEIQTKEVLSAGVKESRAGKELAMCTLSQCAFK